MQKKRPLSRKVRDKKLFTPAYNVVKLIDWYISRARASKLLVKTPATFDPFTQISPRNIASERLKIS